MRASTFRSAVSTVLILTSFVTWSAPAYALRAAGVEAEEQQKKLLAALSPPDTSVSPAAPDRPGRGLGLRLPFLKRAAAGVEGVSNPFLRGEVPSWEMLQVPRLHVRTADRIAAGLWVTGHVGGNDRDGTDGLAQDIFTNSYNQAGVNLRLHWFEGAKHTAYGEDVEYGVHEGGQTIQFAGATREESILADVTENTGAIIRGQQDMSGAGGTSLVMEGPLVQAFGGGQDQLGAAVVIGAVPANRMRDFLPSKGGAPIDPNPDQVIDSVRRLLYANGLGWKDARIFYQRRKRSETDLLEPLQKLAEANPGMELRVVKDGTMDGGILSILGSRDGKYNVIVGTVGSAEGTAKYLTALALDDIAVGFRIYSPFAKNVADIAGSLSKTLADLTPEQVAEAKKKAKLTDVEWNSLPRGLPIHQVYLATQVEDLRKVRPWDADEITSPKGKLFHNETLTFPRKRSDAPSIRLYDSSGKDVIHMVEGVTWKDRIISGVSSVILDSRTLGVAGPRQLERGRYQVQHLVIERVEGRQLVWVGPGEVNWEELKAISRRLFAGEAPGVLAAGLEAQTELVERVVASGQLDVPLRANGGTVVVSRVSASQEPVAMELLVQVGLEAPQGIPQSVLVRSYSAGLEAARRQLASNPPLSRAVFLLNNQVVNRQTVSDWVPAGDYRPVLADPRISGRDLGQVLLQIVALADWARKNGKVFEINSVDIIQTQQGAFAIIQAA